jgi:hypothetical protein
VLRLALAGAENEADLVSVTCSPREWAALSAVPGNSVIVRVPDGAARLVASAADATLAQFAQEESLE